MPKLPLPRRLAHAIRRRAELCRRLAEERADGCEPSAEEQAAWVRQCEYVRELRARKARSDAFFRSEE